MKYDIQSFIDFEVWDFPGNIEIATLDPQFFTESSSLIFVIDAQDEILEALERLYVCLVRAISFNKHISIEVFIHKVDGLSDDSKVGSNC